MPTTGKPRGDGVLAASVALAVNGLIAWQLQALLAPRSSPAPDAATAALQVVWIAAVPHRRAEAAPSRPRTATAPASSGLDRPPQVRARADLATTEATNTSVDPTPARPMTAVYLQQAGQWAQQHPAATAPADPFANRHVALTDQAASRFRLKRPASVAGTLAMVGLAFGGPGYTTDDCELIRGRVVGLVVGGDEAAVQQDLDYERRHCQP